MKTLMSILLGLTIMSSSAHAVRVIFTNVSGNCYIKYIQPDGYWKYVLCHSGPCVNPAMAEMTVPRSSGSCPYAVGPGASTERQYATENACADLYSRL